VRVFVRRRHLRARKLHSSDANRDANEYTNIHQNHDAHCNHDADGHANRDANQYSRARGRELHDFGPMRVGELC
jgi:hypothetical protein